MSSANSLSQLAYLMPQHSLVTPFVEEEHRGLSNLEFLGSSFKYAGTGLAMRTRSTSSSLCRIRSVLLPYWFGVSLSDFLPLFGRFLAIREVILAFEV